MIRAKAQRWNRCRDASEVVNKELGKAQDVWSLQRRESEWREVDWRLGNSVDRSLGAKLKGCGYKSWIHPNWMKHTKHIGKKRREIKGMTWGGVQRQEDVRLTSLPAPWDLAVFEFTSVTRFAIPSRLTQSLCVLCGDFTHVHCAPYWTCPVC